MQKSDEYNIKIIKRVSHKFLSKVQKIATFHKTL